jgi:hypothetical protein
VLKDEKDKITVAEVRLVVLLHYVAEKSDMFKGTMSRDFLPLSFFYQKTLSGAQIHELYSIRFAYGFVFAWIF